MKLSNESVRDHESVIFSCFMLGETLQEHRLSNHSLVLVCDGEIDILDKNSEVTVKKGEYVFLKRDCQVRIHKHSAGEIPYSAMSIRFKRPALRIYFRQLKQSDLPSDVRSLDTAATKIERNLYLDSLFSSLRPFLNSGQEPSQEFIDMRFTEALGCLLRTAPAFYPTLFDFNEEWKIDLLKFMEEHYTKDMSMEEFAIYTGRSLATFKRDFAKLSALTPQKWLIERRLIKAAELLSKGMSVSDTYIQVGFHNRSHFTKLFTAKYNCPPSMWK
ncbi:MAG: AraC family transcriptional regulator [Muribaculaceae bacterium]|nr:AraC family transcriptional regulator [Muribaculaceae bacterium]MDE7188550.1 AraC family transcriptional regulator [Muribaculaceae bacterium]